MRALATDKLYFLIIPLILFASHALSQTWYLTRGLSTDEVAWGVDVDNVGDVYWAVEEKDQWPFWYYNIFLFKINPDGQEEWQVKVSDGEYNEIAFKLTVADSAIYLSGRSDSSGVPTSGDAFVSSFRLNDGGVNWEYQYEPTPDYGYEEVDGLMVQPDGIYFTGWTKGQSTDEDFLIQKISLSGQYLWSNSWDYNNQFDGANGHMAMDKNYIFAAGHVNLLEGSLVCFNRTDGSYVWDVTWNATANDEVLGLTMSADSMLYTVGYYSPVTSQICLKQFSTSGQLTWTSVWGGGGSEDARTVVADGDSIIYVVGATTSYGNGQKDIVVLKFNSAGDLLDSLLWGGAYDEVASDAVLSGDYLYITGYTQSYGNGEVNGDHKADALLLKVDGRNMLAPGMSSGVLVQADPIPDPVCYPNPVASRFTLRIPNQDGRSGSLEIYHINGEPVFKRIVTLPATLQLNLPPGMYVYRISGHSRTLGTGKFLAN